MKRYEYRIVLDGRVVETFLHHSAPTEEFLEACVENARFQYGNTATIHARDTYAPREPRMTTDAPLPREELFLKLLKMTTSDNDNIALTAIRKANELMRSANWDWDKLIAGKIKVVANPFANLATPPTGANGGSPLHSPAYGAPKPRPPKPPPPPPPPPRAVNSTTPNRYAGFCYCCGIHRLAGAAYLFTPLAHNKNAATTGSTLICGGCNSNAYLTILATPAPHQKVRAPRGSMESLA